MSESQASETSMTRRIACARCGTEFGCDLSGTCWCAAEDVKLPIPALDGSGGDCLCKECLQADIKRPSAISRRDSSEV